MAETEGSSKGGGGVLTLDEAAEEAQGRKADPPWLSRHERGNATRSLAWLLLQRFSTLRLVGDGVQANCRCDATLGGAIAVLKTVEKR